MTFKSIFRFLCKIGTGASDKPIKILRIFMGSVFQGKATEIVNNPIKISCDFKEHALNYQDKKYPMIIVMDAFLAFATIK